MLTEAGERYVKFLAKPSNGLRHRFNLRSYNADFRDIENVELSGRRRSSG